jgi:hypothetical protein
VYGRVAKLVSDNEPILCADAWMDIHKKLGTKVVHISAYNAKANGSAEVMVKQLKSTLSAFERQGLKWWIALPACERAYNDSVHTVTGYTPFYLTFGRHPLPDLNPLLEPHANILIQEFVNHTQAELARVHGEVSNKLHENRIRETTKRNAKRSPTIDYKVGDMVYLETSQLKKPPALAPLRSGPYAITKLAAEGNAAFLEGFRHPFSVELLTPALCYANGINPHLTKHNIAYPNPEMNVTPVAQHVQRVTDSPVQETDVVFAGENLTNPSLEFEVELEGQEDEVKEPLIVQEAIEDFLEDNEEVWEYQPEIRVVPSTPNLKPAPGILRVRQGGMSALGVAQLTPPSTTDLPANEEEGDGKNEEGTNSIVQIGAHVILPAQLPADITEVIEVTGRSKNSAVLLCRMSNGQKCRVTLRQLVSILGHDRVALLLAQKKK